MIVINICDRTVFALDTSTAPYTLFFSQIQLLPILVYTVPGVFPIVHTHKFCQATYTKFPEQDTFPTIFYLSFHMVSHTLYFF